MEDQQQQAHAVKKKSKQTKTAAKLGGKDEDEAHE